MPTGLPAATTIGRSVTIGEGCLLRSTVVEDECVVGDKCVLLEGSLVEKHSVLAPGSVLPPGRRIPSGQLWAGSPAKYVRDLTKDEVSLLPFGCLLAWDGRTPAAAPLWLLALASALPRLGACTAPAARQLPWPRSVAANTRRNHPNHLPERRRLRLRRWRRACSAWPTCTPMVRPAVVGSWLRAVEISALECRRRRCCRC